MSEIPGIIKTCDELIRRLDELRLELDKLRQRSSEGVTRALGMSPGMAAAYLKGLTIDSKRGAERYAGSFTSVVAHYNETRRKAIKLGLKAVPLARFDKKLGFDALDLQIRLGCIQIREYLKNMTDQGSG